MSAAESIVSAATALAGQNRRLRQLALDLIRADAEGAILAAPGRGGDLLVLIARARCALFDREDEPEAPDE